MVQVDDRCYQFLQLSMVLLLLVLMCCQNEFGTLGTFSEHVFFLPHTHLVPTGWLHLEEFIFRSQFIFPSFIDGFLGLQLLIVDKIPYFVIKGWPTALLVMYPRLNDGIDALVGICRKRLES